MTAAFERAARRVGGCWRHLAAATRAACTERSIDRHAAAPSSGRPNRCQHPATRIEIMNSGLISK